MKRIVLVVLFTLFTIIFIAKNINKQILKEGKYKHSYSSVVPIPPTDTDKRGI